MDIDVFSSADEQLAGTLLSLLLGAFLSLALIGCGAVGGGGDVGPPGAPSGLSAQSQDAAVDLEWNEVQPGDLAGYNVYRSTSSIEGISGMAPVNRDSAISEVTYTDEGVENGSAYHYVVTAVDEAGNESNSSSEVEVTPFSDPPGRP